MSGSYGYLSSKFPSDLFADDMTMIHLDNMATRLIELDYVDAAKETLELIAMIKQAKVRAEVFQNRLDIVWKAVEKYEDGNMNKENVNEAIRKYRGEFNE